MKRILLLLVIGSSTYVGASDVSLSHAAIWGELLQLLRLLNEAGDSYTPAALGDLLGYAAAGATDNPEVAEMLIMRGAQVNIKFGPNQQTPLFNAVRRGNIATTKLLVRHKADINMRNHYGDMPLLEAIERGKSDIVSLLLQNKASVDIPDEFGVTALSPVDWARFSPPQEDRDKIEALLAPYRTR